jgi:uncharacterized protein with PIN domain
MLQHQIKKGRLCFQMAIMGFAVLGCDLESGQGPEDLKSKEMSEFVKRERELVVREAKLQKKAAELEIQRRVLAGELVKLSHEKMKSVVKDVQSEIGLEETIKTKIQTVQHSVREKMRARSLLDNDLGEYGRLLRMSGRKAFESKDFMTSLAHYTELLGLIDALEINAEFIEKKLIRVNQFYKTKTLTALNKRDAQKMLLNASEALRDKRFSEANDYLNRLFMLLSAKQRETNRG